MRSSLLAAIAQSCVPHRLTCGDPVWPLDIIAGGGAQDVGRDGLGDYLSDKDLLVIGCSLDNYAVPVPEEMLQTSLVIQIRTRTAPSHYGMRSRRYGGLDPETWECETDMSPCTKF